MDELRSLKPEIDERTRVIVLGSMPGAVSLKLRKYYAHGRNRFWPLMEEIAGVPADAPYRERVQRLLGAGVGLWDTLEVCHRRGSLDSSIRMAEPNDFAGLLAAHPTVSVIALNGRKAADVFRRTILPTLSESVSARLTVLELPSTSPANARGGFGALLGKWSVLSRWVNAPARAEDAHPRS